MASIEEQRPRPDVDRQFVACGEVMIEADEQELLDFCVAIRERRRLVDVRDVAAMRFRHETACSIANPIAEVQESFRQLRLPVILPVRKW